VNNPGYSPDVRFCPDVGAQAAAREPHVEGLGQGLAGAAASIGKGVLGGVTGVITEPVKGGWNRGITGLGIGIGKGVSGLFTKPYNAVFDASRKVSDGYRASTRESP